MNNFYGFLTKKGKNIFLITLLSSALLFASCINDLFNDDKSSKKQETQTEQTGSEELIPVKINISNKKQIENILQNVKPQKNISQARAASPQNVALKYKILYKKVTDTSQSSCELTDSSAVLQLSKGTWDFTLVAYYNDTSDKEMVVFSGDILNKEIIPGKKNSLEFTLKEPDSGKGNISITLKLPVLTDYDTLVKAQLKNSSLNAIYGYDESEFTIYSGNPFVYSLNNVPHGNYFVVFSIKTTYSNNTTLPETTDTSETTVYPVPVRVVTNLSSESEETLDDIRNVCVITYDLGTDSSVSWTAAPERVYKKHQNVTLPTYEKLAPLQTKIFNGWKVQGSTDSESKTTMTITQNVTLEPDWITTTLYVDGADEAESDALKTLQDAVTKLVTYEALDGNDTSYQHEWTINVNGTCYGATWLVENKTNLAPLKITKLTITGDNNAQDILDRGTLETENDSWPVITNAGTYPLYIKNLTIQNGSNSAGGGLNISNTTAYLDNVVLIDNKASDNGGAIALTNSILFIYGGCQIGQKSSEAVAATDTACSNRAGKKGGGIYADGNSTIYFGYTAADENNVTMTAETGTPSNIITYNYGAAGNGGGICCLGKLYINGGTISYNSAYNGGGISVSNETHLTGTTISGNKATSNGGGIYVGSGTSARLFLFGATAIGVAPEEPSFATSESNSNSATNGGGIYLGSSTQAYLNYTSDGIIDESGAVNITYNYAKFGNNDYGGGGIYAENNSKLYIAKGTTINYNASNKNGGGVFGNGNTIYMSGGTIYGNDAQYGGGIYLAGTDEYKGTLYMYGDAKIGTSENLIYDSDVDIYYSNGASYGGGIYINKLSQAYLGYSGIDEENNLKTETLKGGVCFNCAFIARVVTTGFGGGVYNKGILRMNSGNISHNTSSETCGGGVYNVSKAEFSMTGGAIESNSAVYGGGVYNEGIFNVSKGNIKSNTVTENGGGIYTASAADTDETVLEGSEITENTAKNGGGVYIAKGKLDIKGATIFKENTATGLGGAIGGEIGYYINIEDQGVSAYAYIEPNSACNDIYLNSLSSINLSGNTLSPDHDYIARFTPYEYVDNVTFIDEGDAVSYKKFQVTPQSEEDTTTGTVTEVQWETTSNGKIQKKQP